MINKVGLILGIVGLILSLVMGTMYYKQKRETRELIAKGAQDLILIEKASKLREDSIALEIKRRDSTIKNLTIAQEVAKESLNSAIKVSKSLSADLRKAKANRDTVDYYTKCDSLSEQVAVLEAENDSYQNKVDELNISFTKQLGEKDVLLKSKDELYGKLREAFNGSSLKIDQLNKEKEGLNVKLQRSRRTSRLVTLLGIVAAGTVYITTR
jgi:hypothetical protein